MTTPLTDWAGNIVSAGDILVVVRVTNPYTKSYDWDIVREYPIAYQDEIGRLWCTFDTSNSEYNIGSVRVSLCKHRMSFEIRTGEILCIKGLSDNQEAFYLEYFKVK